MNADSIQQVPPVAIEVSIASTKMATHAVTNIQVPLPERSQRAEDVDEFGGVYLGPDLMVDKTADKVHFSNEHIQIAVI